MVWMTVTYNLFAAIANPVYGTSHYLMVSLSTRDLDQRGKLSVVANIPAVAGNGLISSIVMPLILGWINSAGSNNVLQNRWQMVMTVFAVLAFVGCVLEYFFTRERITEEDMVELEGENRSVARTAEIDSKSAAVQNESAKSASAGPSTLEQLKAAASDTYWWIIIIFYLLSQAGVMFKGGYVCNIF